MSEQSMEERVARAIAGANYPGASQSDIDEMWEGFSLEAEAAIKAMREPDIKMIAAFWRQKNCGTQEVGARGDATSDYDAWRAAIDAALVGEVG